MDFTHQPNRIVSYGSENQLLAEITFPSVDDSTVDIDHTFVDPSLRGQNIADQLMRAVVEILRTEDKKAILTCPYAVHWFDKHPELSDLVKETN